MDKQSKKENYLQKLLGKRAKAQSADDSLQKKKDLDDILEDLVAAFPEGCFCPPTPETVTQIETALNALLVWSTSAPISSSLKMKLQDAINDVKDQLDADPFSCCDTIKALEVFEFVLLQVIDQPLVGIPFKVHLQNLAQQLQALFAEYIACLACTPGPTEPTGAYSFSEPISIFTVPATLTVTNTETQITTVTINLTQNALIELRGLIGWSVNFEEEDVSVIWRLRRGIGGTIIWEGHDGLGVDLGELAGHLTAILHVDNGTVIGNNIYELTAMVDPTISPDLTAEINGPIVLAATGYPV
ncbi:hypothetical protein CN980_20795 [Bacillus cereus]|uniref:Uncharacterized protein n=1 Tax=Bacillus cereus TaxID=1396 RepID=A0A9X7C8Z3_BACCE|nr:hypothetical protein [Bacillus cereus]PGO70451.1 hypothetical protein CN980_20795 [Bacillus cereus]